MKLLVKNRLYSGLLLALLFGGLFSLPCAAGTLNPKLQAQMNAADPGQEIPVIIQLASQVSHKTFVTRHAPGEKLDLQARAQKRRNMISILKLNASQTQGKLIDRLRQKNPRKNLRKLWINNSIATQLTSEEIESLRDFPGVASIRLDEKIALPHAAALAAAPAEGNILDLNVPPLWDLGFTGAGMVVAILDSGVDFYHPDLRSSWRGGSNSWLNTVSDVCGLSGFGDCGSCDLNETTPCDFPDAGIAHGTSVAGLIVGGDAGGSSIGTAPGAQWIAAKIFTDGGLSLSSSIHMAFQWVLDPDGNPSTDDAPDVVNNSWGLSGSVGSYNDAFRNEIQMLKAAGIAVIASAGNDGPNPSTDASPANYPETLSVGAIGTLFSSTTVSSFSSRGPSSFDGSIFPDLVAPGFHVRSTDYTNSGTNPLSYTMVSGTSFSAPQVSGVIALLRQAFPLTPLTDIEQAVIDSALDLGPLGPDNSYGHGRVNALAAYNWLEGLANLAIIDPTPPADDLRIDFGELEPGAVSNKSLYCSNSGRGELKIDSIQVATGGAAFRITADQCSGTTLTAGQQCRIDLQMQGNTPGPQAGTLTVVSSDTQQAQTVVTLVGTISAQVVQLPEMSLSDSLPPEFDASLPFGAIPVGQSRDAFVQIRNQGAGALILDPLDRAALGEAFTILADNCSGSILAQDQSCSVSLRFTALAHTRYSAQLRILSNDPVSPLSIVSLSGFGNSPPPTPALVSPANGASLSLPLEFTWRQQPDPDGDPVTNILYISETSDFSTVIPLAVSPDKSSPQILFAQLGGLLLFGGLFGLIQRKNDKRLLLILLLSLSLLLTSCGGGGGGGNGENGSAPAPEVPQVPQVDATLRSKVVSTLDADTLYYWKVVAEDGQGGSSESGVSTFTTR